MESGLPINLKDLLLRRSIESYRVEFKKGWDEQIKGAVVRTVCAFANDLLNGNGGYIVLGVEEREGKALLPPAGLDHMDMEKVQKEILWACKAGISPEYLPHIFVETCENKTILVIWSPPGENRPYEAPKRDEKTKTYWVRLGPETKVATGDLRRQLMEQAGKIPYDDRRSLYAIGDISMVLVRRYLEEIRSSLASMDMDAEEICNKLKLVVPVNGHKVPKNVALLFFSEDPERFFTCARIEVVQFADDAGGDLIDEMTFNGPLPMQVRSCLKYLKGFGGVIIEKFPDRAEAKHTIPYPYGAMEEAIVNAVHHRSYEYPPDPVKIYCYPDRMEITSYPGPVRGIEPEHFKTGRIPMVQARNRRIGDFLKGLGLAEARGTGVPKIQKMMLENGSPPAEFNFDEDWTYFQVTLPIHPRCLEIKGLRERISENAALAEKPGPSSSAPPAILQIPDIYKNWLISQCQYMDLKNLMDKGKAIRVELPEVFIPLYTDPQGEKNKKGKEPGDEDRKPVDIEEMAARNNCLLIEGQAGSGKTTLLKHLAYTIINNSNPHGFAGYLPVLVFLKDLQTRLKEKGIAQANALEAERFLGDYLSPNGLDMETVKGYCRIGKAVFLLDGLDELEPELRETVLKSLAGFRAANHDCRMVLSGRPHGIDNAALNHFGDHRARINSLNMPQVERFINSWFDSIFHKGSQIAERTAGEMIGEIRSHESVAALINTPLMLAAVCILYYDNRRLPDQRADLYKMFVDNLIHRRFTDPERVKNFLIALAYQVHNTGKRGFSKDFALEILGEVNYPRAQGETERDYRKRLEENKPLLEKDFDEVEQNCGLLKLEKGQYDFWHLTFQEFLAARYIATKRFDYAREIENYWDNNWYKEVIELLIGFLSIENQGWANRIVREELEKADPVPFRRWRLASQSLLDIHKDNRDADVTSMARERLLYIFKSCEAPKIFADAGEILGWLGDPRPDLEEFVEIEGGIYNLETLGSLNIKTFAISKYPVTNQWFEKFIMDGGYKNFELWDEEGVEWLKKTGHQFPEFWHERKWKCPNFPVVGVSWHEANAFCRWLTLTRNDGFDYHLPAEQEWQAAAAGKENREYPWGQWEEGRCNTHESDIGKTSSVGIFAKGNTPEGVADLAGNVWEWTCSEFIENAPGMEPVSPGGAPVIRGGAWAAPREFSGNEHGTRANRRTPDQTPSAFVALKKFIRTCHEPNIHLPGTSEIQ